MAQSKTQSVSQGKIKLQCLYGKWNGKERLPPREGGMLEEEEDRRP